MVVYLDKYYLQLVGGMSKFVGMVLQDEVGCE